LLRIRFFLALLSALIVSGCWAYQHYEASQPETVKQTESMLSDAGFTTIRIDTSEQVGLATNLPSYELRGYPVSSGAVYWYYDPKMCVCVFEGHQKEYESYQMIVRQNRDTTEYAAESQEEEVASLNALNGSMFPPPIFMFGGFGGFGGGFGEGRGFGGGERGEHGGGERGEHGGGERGEHGGFGGGEGGEHGGMGGGHGGFGGGHGGFGGGHGGMGGGFGGGHGGGGGHGR
jgi:hypothetical protein